MPPCYDRPATDFGEPERPSYFSKMVPSIAKLGGLDTVSQADDGKDWRLNIIPLLPFVRCCL